MSFAPWISDRLSDAGQFITGTKGTPNPTIFSPQWTGDRVQDFVEFNTNDIPAYLGEAGDKLREMTGMATPSSGNEYQQTQRSADIEKLLYGSLGTAFDNPATPYSGDWFAGQTAPMQQSWDMLGNYYGSGAPMQAQQAGMSSLFDGLNRQNAIAQLGQGLSSSTLSSLAGIMSRSPSGYAPQSAGFTPQFAGALPGMASPSAPGYGAPALSPFTPQVPQVGYQPQTQGVNFQASTPQVDFQAQAPNLGFTPQQQQVNFNPQVPGINFQPQTPQVQFQADTPQIGFNAEKPQVGFNPTMPNINFNPTTPQIGFTPTTPQIGLQGRADPTGSLQSLMNPGGPNPYLDSMIGSAARIAGREFNENILPGITDRAIASGQMGGSRPEIAKGIAARGLGESIADMSANMYGQDYQQSMNRALQASGISADLMKSADQAAIAQGQLGMQGQQLAGQLATEQARFGAGTQQLGGQLATEQARLGLDTQRLGGDLATEQARLGMQGQQLGGQLAMEQARIAQGAQDQNLQAALEQARMGLGAQQLGGQLATSQAQLGMGAQELGLQAATEQARLGQASQELGMQGALGQAQMGMSAQDMNLQRALQQAQLGLGAQQLGLEGALGQAQYGQAGQDLGAQLAMYQAGLGLDTQRLQEQALNNLWGTNLGQNQLMANLGIQNAQLGLQGQQLNEQQRAAMTGEQMGAAQMGVDAIGQGSDTAWRQKAAMLGMLPGLATMPSTFASDLYNIGSQQQAQQQAMMDAARMQWDTQQQLPMQNLGQQTDIWNQLRSAELAQAGMQSLPQQNNFATLAGLGMMGLSLL